MRIYINLLVCTLLLAACSHNSKEQLHTAFNDRASLPGVPGNPLNDYVINSFINTGKHTASTLYGNAAAARYARTNRDGNYPAGAVLSLVTWKQQPDPRWFGGNIPDAALSVEVVTFGAVPGYKYYSCHPWQEKQTPAADSMMKWIISQRGVIVPNTGSRL
ncbi:hypothetical protein ACTHGU_06700 [Chitinophagaceae bacterium MMS25-I14]